MWELADLQCLSRKCKGFEYLVRSHLHATQRFLIWQGGVRMWSHPAPVDVFLVGGWAEGLSSYLLTDIEGSPIGFGLRGLRGLRGWLEGEGVERFCVGGRLGRW